MVNQGILIPSKTFTTQTSSIYSTSWFSPLSILSWTINRLNIYDTSFKSTDRKGKLKFEKYIYKSKLEDTSQFILDIIHKNDNDNDNDNGNGYSKYIFTKKQFQKKINSFLNLNLSNEDLNCLIIYLYRDLRENSISTINFKKLINNDINNEESLIIKFKSSSTKDQNQIQNQLINEEDKTIALIKTNISSLEIKINSLNLKIQNINDKLKQSLLSKNRQLSKIYLKSKKLYQGTLLKNLDSLNKLQEILIKIDDANSNIEMFNILEKSSNTLSSLNKKLSIDKIDNLVDGLNEQIDDVEQVSQALQQHVGGNENIIDDDEIENELADLLKQEKDTVTTGTSESNVDDLIASLDKLSVTDLPKPHTVITTDGNSENEEFVDALDIKDTEPSLEKKQAEKEKSNAILES